MVAVVLVVKYTKTVSMNFWGLSQKVC